MRPDRAIGAITALVVGVVTALAFAQSFHALRSFAEAQEVVPAGWGWMFAATIDGSVLAALLTSLSLSLQERPEHRSVGGTRPCRDGSGDLAGVQPSACPAGMARWGAAVPPVAVLAGLEVLLLQVRRAAIGRTLTAPVPPPAATPAQAWRRRPACCGNRAAGRSRTSARRFR